MDTTFQLWLGRSQHSAERMGHVVHRMLFQGEVQGDKKPPSKCPEHKGSRPGEIQPAAQRIPTPDTLLACSPSEQTPSPRARAHKRHSRLGQHSCTFFIPRSSSMAFLRAGQKVAQEVSPGIQRVVGAPDTIPP